MKPVWIRHCDTGMCLAENQSGIPFCLVEKSIVKNSYRDIFRLLPKILLTLCLQVGNFVRLLILLVCLFCFVSLFPKSTVVLGGGGGGGAVSSPSHTYTWAVKPVIRAHTFACNCQQQFLNESAEGRRMIFLSISTKVWDRAGIELATPGSAVRCASVDRHVTDCATPPSPSADDLCKQLGHRSVPEVIFFHAQLN